MLIFITCLSSQVQANNLENIPGLLNADNILAERMESGQIIRTKDRGFLIVTHSSPAKNDLNLLYLSKANQEGEVSWHKEYEWDGVPKVKLVQQTEDFGYALILYVQKEGVLDKEIHFLRIDQYGEYLWKQKINASDIHIFQETMDKGFIFAGYQHDRRSGKKDAYVLKIDKDGKSQRSRGASSDISKVLSWERNYGGRGDEEARHIQQVRDKDGYNDGYIFTGYTTSKGSGARDVYIMRLDAYGSIKWERTYGGARDDEGYYILPYVQGVQSSLAPIEGFFLTGYSRSRGNTSADLYFIHIDTNGHLSRWGNYERAIDGLAENYLGGNSDYIGLGINLLTSEWDRSEIVIRAIKYDSLSAESEIHLFSFSDDGRKRMDRGYEFKGRNISVLHPNDNYYKDITDLNYFISYDFSAQEIRTHTLRQYLEEYEVNDKSLPKDLQEEGSYERLHWDSTIIRFSQENIDEVRSQESCEGLAPLSPPEMKGYRGRR